MWSLFNWLYYIIINVILEKNLRLNILNEILAIPLKNSYIVSVCARIIFNSTSTRDYASTYISIFKQRCEIDTVDLRPKSQRIVQFCLLCVFFLFLSLLSPSRLRIEVTYRRVGCRSSSDRHVSADFPIKPTEQLSIGSNQWLLSACPAIFLEVGVRSGHDRVRSYQLSELAIFHDSQNCEFYGK